MIASVAFRNFKALRNTQLTLRPCNVVIGPNGSGKTSLIQALLQLRTLARLAPAGPVAAATKHHPGSPEIDFRFIPPYEALSAHLACVSDAACDAIEVAPADAPAWPRLRERIGGIRAFLLDHYAMAVPSDRSTGAELASNGANLAAVLATLHSAHVDAFQRLEAELVRLLPEFSGIVFNHPTPTSVELCLRLRGEDRMVTAEGLSQGILHFLAIMVLAFHPTPPTCVCMEEVDRGIHPRLLRVVRDLLYRLSYPESQGLAQAPVQVIATTHSPYLLDLFRDHPEEIVISHKSGNAARFENLGDRKDLAALLEEGSLGDIWFSGILGGVPEE
ncbi:MAG: AAA family ATPase [Opitutales bacterium]